MEFGDRATNFRVLVKASHSSSMAALVSSRLPLPCSWYLVTSLFPDPGNGLSLFLGFPLKAIPATVLGPQKFSEMKTSSDLT